MVTSIKLNDYKELFSKNETEEKNYYSNIGSWYLVYIKNFCVCIDVSDTKPENHICTFPVSILIKNHQT